MIHHLALTLEQRPEVLERVLRVVRHRGFRVCSMNMTEQDDKYLQLNLAVDSDKAVELLSRQLDKLLDVTHCVVSTPAAMSQTVNG
ncbi:acetolactate synthase 2 small subunit [Shewanella avicenniae]|uniref:Acetolactate synthase 2 small subunit n=1 Tax=Shewanella avicenniae TaxID=2814294 RepID=A0ABX7QQV9_9GAMM|nr:acetolactate synthase 2 small subunit [Shewanella avicenniae]QSX33412.1 acetolactate synthase 2 small subunit [Shewanella avicenniae]